MTGRAITARATPNRFGLTEAVFGFAIGLVVSFIVTDVAAAASGTHLGSGSLPVGVIAADVAGLWVGLLGAVWFASRTKGSGDLSTDFGLRIRHWLDIVGGAAIGLAGQYLLIPALYWPFEQFDHSLSHQLSKPAQNDVGSAHTVVAVAVLMLFLAVGAPFVEELFFRGLVLRGLMGRAPTAVAIVVSALLFALAHFEAVQFAGLAAFGVVLGVLAWWTGRLVPGMAAHAAFNAAAVISLAHVK